LGRWCVRGYDLVPNVPDRDAQLRTAIVFRLKPLAEDDVDEELAEPEGPLDETTAGITAWAWTAPLMEVRAAALAAPLQASEPKDVHRNLYRRSESVRAYVLRRATGSCESCHSPAPFQTANGRPYLEPHHVRRLSDGGPDHPGWVIGLCPNCHRRAHHASDAVAFNGSLVSILKGLEQAAEE
jgi:5-methylcytosine-specific restriction protein A